MTLRDYILGRRIILYSSFPRPEVEKRVNNGTGSMFSPFHHGVTGGAYFGRVRLAWSIPLFANGFRPVFAGCLTENLGRTELEARYGAPLYLLAFFVFWYGILSLIMLSGLASSMSDGPKTGNEWMILVILPIFFVAPFIFHFVFNKNADAHFEAMLNFLEREAGLRP